MIFAHKRPPAGSARTPRCKRLVSAILLVVLTLSGVLNLLFLSACAPSRRTSALTLLEAMVAADADHPAGDVYLTPDAASLAPVSGATDNSDAQGGTTVRTAPPALLRAAFGRSGTETDAIPWELALVEDGAMRFSTAASPAEWIVLRCANRSDTAAVADMLLRRLSLLRRSWNGNAAGEQPGAGVNFAPTPPSGTSKSSDAALTSGTTLTSDTMSVVDRGQVVVLGRYVLLILCDEPEACLRAARRALS